MNSEESVKAAQQKYYNQVIRYDSSLHGQALKKFFQQLPSRKDVIDQQMSQQIRKNIQQTEDEYFMPSDVFEMHLKEDKDGKESYTMRYRLVMTGCLRSGEKAAVILEDIDCYIDVRCPADADPETFEESLKLRLNESGVYPSWVEAKRMRPFRYYQPEDSDYVRVYFKTLFQRKKCRELMESGEFEYISTEFGLVRRTIETASNDRVFGSRTNRQGSVYYRKAAREYRFTMGDWNVLHDYQVDTSGTVIRSGQCPLVFRMDVADFKPISQIGIDKQKIPSLKFDKTMVGCWDLETYDNAPTGSAPLPEHVFDENGNEHAIIFMDGMSFHWHYDAAPLIVINITTMPTPPRDDCLIIQVPNQVDLIKVKALVLSRMAPDILTGFNDGTYDTPFIFRRAEEYDARHRTGLVRWLRRHTSCVVFNDDTEKWVIGGLGVEDKIKVEADQYIRNEFLKNQGIIGIDTRTVFRKIFPTAEKTSLNFFLGVCKLESKEDMDYRHMFRIFNCSRRFMELFDTDDYANIIDRLKSIQDAQGPDFVIMRAENLAKLGLRFRDKSERQPCGRPWPSAIDHGFDTADSWTVAEQIKLLADSTKVVKYCNVDSIRCIELLIARSVIPDKREVSILSFTSLYDCFYRADGMKVRNLVISEGIKPEWNYAFDNARRGEKSDCKYPGAHVVPPIKSLSRDHVIVKRRRRWERRKMANAMGFPKSDWDTADLGFAEIRNIPIETVSPDRGDFDKGLLFGDDPRWKLDPDVRMPTDEDDLCDRPCTGLDFSSLYPSLMMAYNLSPEKAIPEDADINEVYQQLLKTYPGREFRDLIHCKDFRYGLKDQPEEEKQLVHGRFVRHVPTEVVDSDGKKKTVNVGMGLYPSVLLDLYNQRAGIKKSQGKFALPKEFLENYMSSGIEYGAFDLAEQKQSVMDFLHADRAKRAGIADKWVGTPKEAYFAKQVKEVDHALEFMKTYWFGDSGEYSKMDIDGLYKTVSFYFLYYNSKQLAVKVFMNTFYGESGNPLSPFFILQVAGTITTSGRDNLHMVKDFVLSKGYRVQYGDSVPEDEPILCRRSDGQIIYSRVDELGNSWSEFGMDDHGSSIKDHGSSIKEHSPTDEPLEVWTERGWTRIVRVIRHETTKDIYRVRTPSGIVEVTEDHSLLDPDAREITPKEVQIGTPLLHNPLPQSGVDLTSSWLNYHKNQAFNMGWDFAMNTDFNRRIPNSILNSSRDVRQSYLNGMQMMYQYHPMSKIGMASVFYLYASLGDNTVIKYGSDYDPDDEIIFEINNSDFERPSFGNVEIREITKLPNDGRPKMVYDLETENHHFAAGIGCMIVHNTDSLYICCPEECFQAVDEQYVSGEISKLDYWTRMIEITMETIDKFKDDVNVMLAADNGTDFLRMAYEEVLYPYAMVGKKKYIGIKHEGIVNLSACMPEITPEEFMKTKTLFIRGLEIKKRGASPFLKTNVYSALRDMFNLDTTLTMCEIFEAKLAEVARSDWDPSMFVRTAKYKLPGKDQFGQTKQGNITVLCFADRMRRLEIEHPELGIQCPEVGERFPYVVARKNPWRFDIRGRKNQIKIGEKYEDFRHFNNTAYHEYLGGPIEIDRDYYMVNEISGQFARFIVYHPKYDKFTKDGLDPSLLSDEEYKEADKKAVEYAKKQLQKQYKENFAFQYENHGAYYKNLFKEVSGQVYSGLRTRYGDSALVFKMTQNIATETKDTGEYVYGASEARSQITKKLCNEAMKLGKRGIKKRVAKFIRKCGGAKEAPYLYRLYCGGKYAMNKVREKRVNMRLDEIQKLVDKAAAEYNTVCKDTVNIMSALIDRQDKVRCSVLPPLDVEKLDDDELAFFSGAASDPTDSLERIEKEQETFTTMFDLFGKLVGLYMEKEEIRELQEQLSYMKDLSAGNPLAKPRSIKPKKLIDELEDWLNTDNNWQLPERTPSTFVETSIGNIDLY